MILALGHAGGELAAPLADCTGTLVVKSRISNCIAKQIVGRRSDNSQTG